MTRHNTPQNMTPNEIRSMLVKVGVTQAEIARDTKVQPQSVYKVIEGLSASDRIRRHIAKRTNTDIKKIWPDPYMSGGPRRAGRPVCSGRK